MFGPDEVSETLFIFICHGKYGFRVSGVFTTEAQIKKIF